MGLFASEILINFPRIIADISSEGRAMVASHGGL
jgi:hypothetical protein